MKRLMLAALLATLPAVAAAQGTPAPEGARVYFVNLADGDKVASPVTVIFGLAGMGIAPAEVVKDNTGHHHLLVNRPPLGEGEFGAEEFELAVPANDDNHRHFGGGQTQVTLELPPGQHTLQLVLADAGHVPHVPPVVSDRITITVE